MHGLAYHDYGGGGPHVVAIHGHFGASTSFSALASALGTEIRVTAPDQRGHGLAPRGPDPSVATYVSLLERFLEQHIDSPVVLLGHSMGGTHAILLAERRPDLVSALIVEDQSMVVGPSILDTTSWPRRAPTFMALAETLQARGIEDPSYFMLGAVRYPDGWGFCFDHEDILRSQQLLVGDYSANWRALNVPTLLIRGAESFILTASEAAQMIDEQPNASLREFAGCGHWVHDDDPIGVAEAVRAFVAASTGVRVGVGH